MSADRKDAFKATIVGLMSDRRERPKDELVRLVRAKHPDLFDDGEACYPKCGTRHPKWKHEFDRAVYDLTQTIPKKLVATGRGVYIAGPGI